MPSLITPRVISPYRIDPELLAQAYLVRAVALLNLDRVDEATEDLVRVTSLLPSTHQVYVSADELLTELGNAD
jgi:hypothetical protein